MPTKPNANKWKVIILKDVYKRQALSGLFLAALTLHLVAPGSEDAAQWALFIHLLCAGVMAVVLPIHIYMAAFAPRCV